ncbi:MAG: protein kinase [Polyangiaceae bacterium]|nr:protein kinase [Polyangiaceae bacterium]
MTDALDPEDLAPGTRLGRHEIVRRIAAGGMAIVYEAVHVDLQKRFAVKVMRPELARDQTYVERFVQEARTASKMAHPHIIAVTDVGLQQGIPYLVMEFLEGDDLCTVMEREPRLSVERVADVMLPIISAVAAAHDEHVLHRDIKPENIFLARDRRGRERPMLLDFGVAKPLQVVAPGRSMTRVGEAVGTPSYMSPEQIEGRADIDGRADQYSLGVILYAAITRALPFSGDTLAALLMAILRARPLPPGAHRPDLPAAVDALILRSISRDREGRFASVRELGRALHPFASPLVQAQWAEEFGDPVQVAARIVSAPPPVSAQPTPVAPRPTAPLVSAADLRRFGGLAHCSDEELEAFLRQVRCQRFRPGAQIVAQGAHGNGCYLLVSGEVQVVKTVTNARWTLGKLGPGAVFGQIALVEQVPRTASIITTAESVVVHVDRAAYAEMLHSGQAVARALREQVAISGIRQLRRATSRLAALLSGPGAQRVRAERSDLVFVQAAAFEWGLELPRDPDSIPAPQGGGRSGPPGPGSRRGE